MPDPWVRPPFLVVTEAAMAMRPVRHASKTAVNALIAAAMMPVRVMKPVVRVPPTAASAIPAVMAAAMRVRVAPIAPKTVDDARAAEMASARIMKIAHHVRWTADDAKAAAMVTALCQKIAPIVPMTAEGASPVAMDSAARPMAKTAFPVLQTVTHARSVEMASAMRPRNRASFVPRIAVYVKAVAIESAAPMKTAPAVSRTAEFAVFVVTACAKMKSSRVASTARLTVVSVRSPVVERSSPVFSVALI